MITDSTLRAVGNTLRAYEWNNRLTDDQTAEVEAFIRNQKFQKCDLLQIAIYVNALIVSGRAKPTAGLLLEVLTSPSAHASDQAARITLSRALDVCLYESFRQGEGLQFRSADSFIARFKTDIATLIKSPGLIAGMPSETDAKVLGEIDISAQIILALMNSEHQSAATAALLDYLHCINAIGLRHTNDNLLVGLIRKCVNPSRIFLDLPGLAELRKTARRTAQKWLTEKNAALHEGTISSLSLSFRFLMSTRDTALQAEVMQKHFARAAEAEDPRWLDLATNCLSWILETTLDPALTATGEKLFLDIQRMPSTHQYLAMAIRLGDKERGERWLSAQNAAAATANSRYLEARFHLAFGEPEKSLEALSKPLSTYSAFYKELITETSNSADQVLSKPHPVRKLRSVEPVIFYCLVRTANEAVFLKNIHQFAHNCRESKAEPDNGRTIILAPNHLNFVTQLPVAAVEKARQMGAEIVSMVTGTYPHSDQLTPAAEAMRDVIMPGFYYNRHQQSCAISPEWDMRPHQKKLVYKGINHFHGIHNSLGIHYRRFTIDFDNEVENRQMRINMVMIQGLHDAFEEFLKKIDNKRVYVFVAIGLQAGLGSALRTLVNNAKRPNVRIVHASNGFETFDPAFRFDPTGGNAVASYHSVTDLTDHPDTPLGFRPSPDMCVKKIYRSEQEYRETNASLDHYLNKVDARARTARELAPAPKGPRRRILVIGTILPDLSIPHDHGLAHEDIADWAQHTAEIAQRHNLELIIKPHPAEINQAMGFYVSEKFADLYPSSPNISVLPYDANFHKEVLSSDLAIIWSGTSVMELSLMEHPYVACSRFANEEYPLSIRQFSSRKTYEALLTGKRSPKVNRHGRMKAIDIIHRITTSPLREPSVWPKRQLLNAHVWPPQMDPSVAGPLLEEEATANLARRMSCFNPPRRWLPGWAARLVKNT